MNFLKLFCCSKISLFCLLTCGKDISNYKIWSRLLQFTIMYKIFETNCSFHVKDPTTGKVQFLFFRTFLPISTKSSFWEEDWALGYNSMKFWYFLGISFFPKILNLTLFVNSKDNLYMPCLLLIITFRFSSGEKKIL